MGTLLLPVMFVWRCAAGILGWFNGPEAVLALLVGDVMAKTKVPTYMNITKSFTPR